MVRDSWWPIPNPTLLKLVLVLVQELYRNDELLGDRELNRVSVNPKHQARIDHKSEFELFSDRFTRLFE